MVGSIYLVFFGRLLDGDSFFFLRGRLGIFTAIAKRVPIFLTPTKKKKKLAFPRHKLRCQGFG